MNEPIRDTDHAIHRTSHLGYESENTYWGVLSFMRRRYTRDLAGVDVAVTGIPLDLATAQLNEKMHPWGFGPCDHLAVVDYGDCPLDNHRPATIADSITEHTRRIIAGGTTMRALGGDHFVTYPILKAQVEKHGGPLSLIHFDAHCDTWPDDAPDSLNHGTMFYKAIQDGLIDPKRSVQIGIRTWNDDFMGMNVLGADWVHEHGVKATIARILDVVGTNKTYLTFDIDCLDPAFAPGTGTPVAGGLSSAQALAILRGLVPVKLVGMDVVEVAPSYDHAEITAIAAAHVAAEMLCVLAAQRR